MAILIKSPLASILLFIHPKKGVYRNVILEDIRQLGTQIALLEKIRARSSSRASAFSFRP